MFLLIVTQPYHVGPSNFGITHDIDITTRRRLGIRECPLTLARVSFIYAFFYYFVIINTIYIRILLLGDLFSSSQT